jgi:hypothetical protein
MDYTATFCSIIANANQSKPKKSSHLKEWLGIEISQSQSIRFGKYLETFFNTLIGEYSLIQPGTEFRVTYNNEEHQLDILAKIDDTIFTRELKANLDLDRGKKRDVLRREEAITSALEEMYNLPVDSRVFCPFITTQKVSGLGLVEGLEDFISTFKLNITPKEFNDLGKSEQLHRLLLK